MNHLEINNILSGVEPDITASDIPEDATGSVRIFD